MTFNTTAIILNRHAFKESDLLVTFLSRDFGKMTALAIGAKKIKSKLAGHLEPLREVKLMVAVGREIHKLGQAVTMNTFGVQSSQTPEAVWQAQKAAVLVEKVSPQWQKETRIYDFFKQFLFLNFQSNFFPNLWYFFTFELLRLAGLSPELQNCLHCHDVISPGKNCFDFQHGGLICSACAIKTKEQNQPISNEAIKVLRYLQHYSLTKSMSL
ncbi:MAG: DNA repair protein RecO, partial [Candidatus Magasanikbacteria bacterium]|nr:DNA repair protein RecO [Candidatus Magasanikbacteria bacterium]